MPSDDVLVIGGGGFYGRYVVADVLQHTSASVTIASRRPPADFAGNPRITTVACDLNDDERLKQLTATARVVVHCAGPFQSLPSACRPLRAAIETHTDYIDIAEDREFARRVSSCADEIDAAGITVLSGISVAPAMEALFAALMQPCFDALQSIRTFAAPDTRKHRGNAMFHTMLYGVGRAFEQPRRGQLARVHGWSEPEWVEFPPPLGKRLTYLVLEMADLDILPRLFNVGTVEFKAGSEHVWLNRLLGMAAAMRARMGHPHWENYTRLIRACSWLVGRLGRNEGGVIFEIGGVRAGKAATYRIALIAPHDGGLIPAVLAAMAVQELLSGRLNQRGLLAVKGWIRSDALLDGLRERGLQLWWKPPAERAWQPFSLTALQQHAGLP